MTLQMKYRELLDEGKAEGIQMERIDAIQRMIRKGFAKDIILELGYTEAEYAEAEAGLCQTI